jgi:hypothetical protein
LHLPADLREPFISHCSARWIMPTPISDDAFEYLLARAGLKLTDAEKAELKSYCAGVETMAAKVRQPRGRMAEPVLIYGFAEEDL